MVAHLGVIATCLSHNFARCELGCTNAGETEKRALPESLCTRKKRRTLSFETRDSRWVAAKFFLCLEHQWPVLEACMNLLDSLQVEAWRWIPGPASCKLKTCRQGPDFTTESGAHFDAQAHISTQPPSPREDARFSSPHEVQERSRGTEPPPRGRPQTRLSQRRSPRLRPPLFGPERLTR